MLQLFRSMVQWRIGCSGYHYAEWRGVFYPEDIQKGKWFEFYTKHFNTIELNVTFYRFPRVEFLSNWYNRSPEGFSFSVKAPRLITHFKKFREAGKYISDFYATVRSGLKEKVGCVLFQFPASFRYDVSHLERIAGLVDPSFRNVAEFRHPDWWNENVFRVLREHNISFCSMDHPDLPRDVIATTNHLYHRLHGVPHIYASKYNVEQLDHIAHRVQDLGHLEEANVMFNNTAEGAAVINARQLQEITELVH